VRISGLISRVASVLDEELLRQEQKAVFKYKLGGQK
jgi:hypothetical protein